MEPNLDLLKTIFLSDPTLYPGSRADKERFFTFINETFVLMSTYVISADVEGLREFHKDFNLLVNDWYDAFKRFEQDIKKMNIAKFLFGKMKDPFKDVNYKTKVFVTKYDYSNYTKELFANYK